MVHGVKGEVLRLCDAIGVSSGDIVAFVGAGGKSSAIRTTAWELAYGGLKVIALPTTKMTVPQAESLGPLVVSGDLPELLKGVEGALSSSSIVVAGSDLISKNRVGGLDEQSVAKLATLADVVLVEADGSRGRPVKGTADDEPAVPASATLVVGVAGIEALGKPATEEFVHRPELFSVQSGVGPGHSITARAIARALADGSLAELPDGARAVALITGVGAGRGLADASIIAHELWNAGIELVALSSLTRDEPLQVWLP